MIESPYLIVPLLSGYSLRKNRSDISSDFVHITQRGLGRQIIFADSTDKRCFLELLKAKRPEDLDIVAWCLMDNHFHLLVQGDTKDITKFMHRIQTSYAQRFNGRHGHVGKVFQSRFSSTPIKTNEHILSCIRYIHRNAYDAGALNLQDYPWSSYRTIIGVAPFEDEGICARAIATELFGGVKSLIAFHNDEAVLDSYSNIIRRRRLDDVEAMEIACRQYGNNYSDRIALMPKSERDKALANLKRLGLSIRQIERLTGVGRNIIARAK